MHTVQLAFVFPQTDYRLTLDFQCRKFVPEPKQITDVHWKSKFGPMKQELPLLAIVSRVCSDASFLLNFAV